MSDLKQDQNVSTLSYGQAICDGLKEAALKDSNVIFFAEGLTDPTAVFGTLKDMDKTISKDRLIEMPISENALVGVAIGAAMNGHRPVISFHRVEFALLAMEQIINNAAKTAYLSKGEHSVPMLIRLIVGRGWGQGPNHSQSLESLFSHIPGLKVILPTFPVDAKGLITGAVEDGNPVICIENRWCHYIEGSVPKGYYSLPLDGPKVVKEGSDITIVAVSYMVLEAMMAADVMTDMGINVEVIDLRVSRPLNIEPIKKSVIKTGKLLTVDLGWQTYGIGGEIVSQITEQIFEKITVAPRRLSIADHPTPSSRGLVENYYPDAVSIAKEVCGILNVEENKKNSILELIKKQRKNNPIDTPHPSFKGPF